MKTKKQKIREIQDEIEKLSIRIISLSNLIDLYKKQISYIEEEIIENDQRRNK